MGAVKNIFSPPKPKGPDPGMVKARKEQEERIRKQEQREEERLAGKQAALRPNAAVTGITLFSRTGRRGVTDRLGGNPDSA